MNRELSLLGLAAKAGKLAIGDEAVSDAIRHSKARLIIIASDAAANTKRRFEINPGETHCKRVEIPSVKSELGMALGRNSCAVCALCDIGFAASFLRILSAADPDNDELKSLYERVNGRAEEINDARREKRREEKRLERERSKPWASQPKNEKKTEKKPDKFEKYDKKSENKREKNAFSYKRVYGKPGPVRGSDGKAKAYERGDSRRIGDEKPNQKTQSRNYSKTSYKKSTYGKSDNSGRQGGDGGKSQGQGGFKRAGSFIGKNNGGYKPYSASGMKKSRS